VGQTVNLRDKRAALAFALTALALAVPCVAWYLVGSREAERQAAELTDAAQRTAHETAVRLATQLKQRLNALRDAEALRPFYHYQPFFHDPKGASEGASVVVSPLAMTPSDPLVLVYFQADGASGRVNLPAANAEVQQQMGPQQSSQRDALRYLQHELERGVASILFAVRGESLPQQPDVPTKSSTGAQPQPQQKLQAQGQPRPDRGQRVEVLEKRAWEQNVDAAELYSNLKRRNVAQQQQDVATFADSKDQGNVQVFIGPLKWRTMYVGGEPALVALREVTAPQGAMLQGFVISPAGLADFFRTAGMPARLRPGNPDSHLQASVAIGDEPWRVVVDARTAVAVAQRHARELRRSFLTIFLGGVAIAAIAGWGVVWLVWQTERLARQRAQFAASAAHELRTPLAGLRIFSEMLAEGLGDPSRTKDYARRVADEAERLGRVVANVLGFTRLERGTLAVHPAVGDLTAAVRESVARQHAALEAAGARVEIAITNNVPPVKFDRDAIAQIVQNLLDNAEKHTRSAADRTIHVALAVRNGSVQLSVADHGNGLPVEVRRHLFHPFTRGNQRDAPAGLGLGLVLVKALAEAQGATVTYADAAGGGACFRVTFCS
jgi:signal transduction histidine kinase